MILKNFMVTNPIAVHPDDSLHHVSQIMAWTDTRHLPVTVGDDRLVGIISERDLLAFRAKQPESDPRSTPLSFAMHESPQTAAPESSLTEAAARLAQSQIGCLPVTEQGKLVGLVTRTDVLSAEVRASMEDVSTHLTAADIMTSDPLTANPDDQLADVARIMSRAGFRHLPVVNEEGKAVGILSDRDVHAVPRELKLTVKDAMSRPPLRVWADENCGAVANLFVRFRASALLVTTKDDLLLGIISYIDLLDCLSPRVESH